MDNIFHYTVYFIQGTFNCYRKSSHCWVKLAAKHLLYLFTSLIKCSTYVASGTKSKISLPYIMGIFVFAYFTWDCWRFVVEVDLNCVTDDSFWKEKSIHQSHRLPLKRQLGILRGFKVAPNCRWYHSPSWRSSCSTCSSSPPSPPTWRPGWPGGARPPRRPSSPRRRASSSPRPPRPTAPAWPPPTVTPTTSSPTELGKLTCGPTLEHVLLIRFWAERRSYKGWPIYTGYS